MSEINCACPSDYHCYTSISVLSIPSNGEVWIELHGGCFVEDWENLNREIVLDVELAEMLISKLQKAVRFVKENQND